MSHKKIDALATLKTGKCDWKIKVKVIRNWRGATTSGEQFKCFNVLLIDQQVTNFLNFSHHQSIRHLQKNYYINVGI